MPYLSPDELRRQNKLRNSQSTKKDYFSEEIGEQPDYFSEEVQGKIPNTENLLQRAIRQSRSSGQAFGSFTPSSYQEGVDLARVGLRQLPMTRGGEVSPYTQGPIGIGLNLSGINEASPLVPAPETEFGMTLETSADIAPFVALGLGGATLAGKAGLSGVKKLGKSIFKRELAEKDLPEATKKLSSSIQEVIKRSTENPQKLSIPKNELKVFMENQFSKAKVPYGKQATIFRKWIKKMDELPDNITADILDEVETDFGHAAGFGKEQAKPALSQAAKEVNRFASQKLDEISEIAGVPEFKKQSFEKSKLRKELKAEPSGIETLFPIIKRGKKVVGKEFIKRFLK